MPEIEFTAPEYQQDGHFINTSYRFSGNEHSSWNIYRQGKPWMTLGPGYVAVETLYCGVCATDLVRRHLPFPLPQIIGHEIVGLYQARPLHWRLMPHTLPPTTKLPTVPGAVRDLISTVPSG